MEKCQQLYSKNHLTNINISDTSTNHPRQPGCLSETYLLNRTEKPRQGLVNCGIILKRGDTAMKTSQGVSVMLIWFLENNSWNTNKRK
jgi:hypothetical protein